MVQISTPGVTPNRGMGPPWGAFCQITLTSCYRCLWGAVLMSSLAADVEIWDQVMFKAHSTHCRVHGIKSWKSNSVSPLKGAFSFSLDDVYWRILARPRHTLKTMWHNQPGPNSSPPMLRRHHQLRATENTDQVWQESILCGWTIHMELSAWVSEKDWWYSDF